MEIWIGLEEMRFYAYHGVLEQERRVGNHFSLHLEVKARVEASLVSDRLEDSISYVKLYEAVAQEMQEPRALLEAVVGHITGRIFELSPKIEALRLCLSKCKPPISGDLASSSVRLEVSRDEWQSFVAKHPLG